MVGGTPEAPMVEATFGGKMAFSASHHNLQARFGRNEQYVQSAIMGVRSG
jgi:hypothetical protein